MTKRLLRSNFEPGTTRWAVRRAQWLAMGIPETDHEKPKIAVVNSSSQLSVCYQHLDQVSMEVQQAIRDAGGLPFEIRTTAPSDFITSAGKAGRYLMPSRDLVVNDIEAQVEGAVLDGMILLASCDKTTPAQLMSAARLDIPSLILVCGYQLGGEYGGRSVDIEDVYNGVGALKAGQIDLPTLTAMAGCAIRGPGVCAGMATANSMHCMAEALGMTLPGNAPIRAASPRLSDYAAKGGHWIVKMVEEDIRPRSILTPNAFRNAVTMAATIGCSVNVVRHLAAVAGEAELDIDIVETFAALPSDLGQITQVRPNGPTRIETFDAAGGLRGAMVQLQTKLDLDVRTVEGKRLGDVLLDAPEPDATVIRPSLRPYRPEPGLVILKGSLAPDGSVVKLSAVPEDGRHFQGPAVVFQDEQPAIEALRDEGIDAGSVVVLKGMGPKGGPGTVFAASFMAALVGAGLANRVAVVTDGELSGLNSGITVGQVMPEAAEGGPLAVVEDGDRIEIDLAARSLDLHVPADVIADRLRRLVAIPTQEKGWLRQYRALVQPLSKGAILGSRG